MKLPKRYDPNEAEPRWQQVWEERGLFRFDRTSERPIYSIDTPPPTVSGQLHLGHTYSYSHTDFIARFWRMNGHNVFYPMGFDDNGLPTERLVERLQLANDELNTWHQKQMERVDRLAIATNFDIVEQALLIQRANCLLDTDLVDPITDIDRQVIENRALGNALQTLDADVRDHEGFDAERGMSPYVEWIWTINGAGHNILEIEPRRWGSPASRLAEILTGGPLENVLMPARVGGSNGRSSRERAARLLERVGLSERSAHLPGELSGGEQQRVAVARALVSQPSILLADEPTGNLDEDTAARIIELLTGLTRQQATTMLLVTHSQAVARSADRVLHLSHGQVNAGPPP